MRVLLVVLIFCFEFSSAVAFSEDYQGLIDEVDESSSSQLVDVNHSFSSRIISAICGHIFSCCKARKIHALRQMANIMAISKSEIELGLLKDSPEWNDFIIFYESFDSSFWSSKHQCRRYLKLLSDKSMLNEHPDLKTLVHLIKTNKAYQLTEEFPSVFSSIGRSVIINESDRICAICMLVFGENVYQCDSCSGLVCPACKDAMNIYRQQELKKSTENNPCNKNNRHECPFCNKKNPIYNCKKIELRKIAPLVEAGV